MSKRANSPKGQLETPVKTAVALIVKTNSIGKFVDGEHVPLIDLASYDALAKVKSNVWLHRYMLVTGGLLCAHLCMRPDEEEDARTLMYLLTLSNVLGTELADLCWDVVKNIKTGVFFKKPWFSDKKALEKYISTFQKEFSTGFFKLLPKLVDFDSTAGAMLVHATTKLYGTGYIASKEGKTLAMLFEMATQDYLATNAKTRPAF